MLRSVKQLYGDKLGASDGEVGHVKNFYFDDRTWAARYLVADTGNWLPERQVLISPHALGNPDPRGKVLAVNLTRKQIEDSPSIEWYKPVSRQFEEAYYRYYGWPCYWQDDGLWGMSTHPFSKLPLKPQANRRAANVGPQSKQAGASLRGTREAKGCFIEADDGIVGQVSDFMVDVQSWTIRQLVVKTGSRVPGRKLHVPTNIVDKVHYDGVRGFDW